MIEGFEAYIERINQRLAHYLAGDDSQYPVPEPLAGAMHYGVLNGGKRVRPLLVYLAAEALGSPLEKADATACAFELIHCYSLIHDDLPAMDDDDLRRGKPTLHIQFDEATAILAGDALQTLAFEILADDNLLSAEQRVQLIAQLSRAAGRSGMVSGQVLDLGAENAQLDATELSNVHYRKTGDLIAGSVLSGALIAGANAKQMAFLGEYGYALGLAFQVKDDLLDVTGKTIDTGKQQGADEARNKSTFVSVHGLNLATAQLEDLIELAVGALKPLGSKGQPLASLARFISSRTH